MSDQGKAYAEFIDAELKAERERRVTIDARGAAVVTTSGSLVTLLAAVATFVSSGERLSLPKAAGIPLVISLTVFAVAATLGIMANFNRSYTVAKRVTLERMVGSNWTDGEIDARNIVATLKIQTASTLRKGNNVKARLLTYALAAQVLGLLALTIVVYQVLTSR